MASSTLIGTYHHPTQVELAIAELLDAGRDPRSITVVEGPRLPGGPGRPLKFELVNQRRPALAALRGALAGAVVVGLFALIATAIYVAVMRGGWALLPLTGMFNGVAVGALLGGIGGAIKASRSRPVEVQLQQAGAGSGLYQVVAHTDMSEAEDVRLTLVDTHPDEIEIQLVA